MARLNKKQIKSSLLELNGWTLRGEEIRRKFEFVDFARAMGFVNTVALYAERANHHPDIDIRWNKITLSLSTHSEGGLTAKDISLAKKIDLLIS
ncbi:MAG: 4a-hydroxytetrahydrobiopterin dehydratase [Ignavibacteriae bacterium]|nr:MAG: 4a-hydroxytetrahydrobiopterin dehydratase [Ignavibacteriota bacterium]